MCYFVNNTSRSLVIVDELGRGTCPHDGAAIAAAAMEQVGKKVVM